MAKLSDVGGAGDLKGLNKEKEVQQEAADAAAKEKKRKTPINRSKLGPNYVAPDGGWGWVVAIAAGSSNVSK